VFVQGDTTPALLEKSLQQQLPELSITAFSRYGDLEDASAAARPDALLASPPVLQQRGARPVLQGTRGGKAQEPWLLVSVGAPLESVSGKTIGAVDVMGRNGTQAFVAELLKANDVKVKRVVKSEDLLPLLEFNAADGVVIPGSSLARLVERTQLAIKTKEVSGGPIGLPALAIFDQTKKAAITSAFLRLDDANKKRLGIDGWSMR
jgi:hypothetical protein